jgi:pyruvate,water dikinase
MAPEEGSVGAEGGPVVLDLRREPRARDPAWAGSKAAALARAAAGGFPVLPGFVIATDAQPRIGEVRPAWDALSDHGRIPLVVRSSSTMEDVGTSSMAGRFVSVTEVRGWAAFRDAGARVRASAHTPEGVAPMAVLVQPALEAVRGGVLFGIDPVTGDRRLVVECAPGPPHAIVGGRVTAARYVLTRHGRVVEREPGELRLGFRDRHRLARLARRAERAFGGPQDIEWAVDRRGRLWVFQSRPVTAIGEMGRAAGPLLGAGPVGETFPDPLRPLERDLFVAPLRIGMIEALRAVGVVPHARIARSPVVTTVGGRVAADLELLGWAPPRRGWRVLNPVPPARHLAAAWHVGRLRATLPARIAPIVTGVDARLRTVPPLALLTDRQLVGLLGRVRRELVSVHAFQILAGMLLPSASDRPGASVLGLAALATHRADGRDDTAVIAEAPVVLALVPARVGPPASLPDAGIPHGSPFPDVRILEPREALRLRARWLDELAARAAWALGGRLAAAGRLEGRDLVAQLTLRELAAVVDGGEVPVTLGAGGAGGPPPAPPLPAVFRLTPHGDVVPARPTGRRRPRGVGGRGAGGGRGSGPARHDAGEVRPGDVLIVRILAPSLAGTLPSLAGLVSETGSTLSHLAILARELGVPTVVGFEGACERIEEGAVVVVDGATGEVGIVRQHAEEAA